MDTDRLQCDVPADWVNDFSQCLFEWQGLEGGILAVCAAVFGAFLLWRQIRQSDDHRKNDIVRRHNAARLTLPLALSEVSQTAQQMADEVASVLETFGPDGFARTWEAILDDSAKREKFEPAIVSPEVISAFERFVETLDSKHDIKHVAELMASIQVLVARYNGQNLKSTGIRSNLQSLMIDIAKVKLLNEAIFNYARFVDDEPFGIVDQITDMAAWDAIYGCAQGLVFSRQTPDHFFKDFAERVSCYKENNLSPWLEKFGP